MKARHKGYARYVDDGWIIDTDKARMFASLKWLKNELKEYGCRLHANKFYFQRADKGVKVIGVVIKPHRIYVANRTRSKYRQKIWHYNHIEASSERARKLQASANSYLGLLKQLRAYKYRCELEMLIEPKWWRYLASVKNKTKLIYSEYELC